jgi:hypothetical protein
LLQSDPAGISWKGAITMMAEGLLKLIGDGQSMKRLAFAINVILGLLLGYQLALAIGIFGEKPKMTLPQRGYRLEQHAIPKPDTVTLMSLEEVHLFGQPRLTQRQETGAQVPRVRPKLALRGIIHSTNLRAGRAIIAESDGRDVAYPLGARLPGGMRLTKINYRNVAVSDRGHEKLLHLSNRMASGS